MSRSVAWRLPDWLRHGPLSEFKRAPNTLARDSVQEHGNEALWPIYQAPELLENWIDMTQVSLVKESVLNGEIQASSKLKSIQTLAYRLIDYGGN